MRICKLENCSREHDARGYCQYHYLAIKGGRHRCKEGSCLKFIKGNEYCFKHRGCLEDNCGKPHGAKGYCINHYNIYRNNGKIRIRSDNSCQINDCQKQFYAKDYCRNHYEMYIRRKDDTRVGKPCNNKQCIRTTFSNKDYCSKCQYKIDKGQDPNKKYPSGVKSGELNPRWNGGTSEYKNHAEMKRVRLRKLEDVGCKCEHCGIEKPSNKLEMHHIDKDKTNHAYENFLLLCKKCHKGVYHKGESGRKKHLINGLTYSEIAEKVGCVYETVYRVVNGGNSPTYGEVIKELTKD